VAVAFSGKRKSKKKKKKKQEGRTARADSALTKYEGKNDPAPKEKNEDCVFFVKEKRDEIDRIAGEKTQTFESESSEPRIGLWRRGEPIDAAYHCSGWPNI